MIHTERMPYTLFMTIVDGPMLMGPCEIHSGTIKTSVTDFMFHVLSTHPKVSFKFSNVVRFVTCDNVVFKINTVSVLPLARTKIFVHIPVQMLVHTVGLVAKFLSNAMEKLLLPFSVVSMSLNTVSE